MSSPDEVKDLIGQACPLNNIEDASTIFSILPEIWDHIFQYLTHSDYLVLINSCPEWRDLFREKTAGKLYPLVIPILLEHYPALSNCLLDWRKISSETKSVANKSLMEPYSSPKMYWTNLATLNYEWSPQIRNTTEMLRQNIWNMNARCYSIDDQAQVDKLLSHFRSFDGNPFPTGYLRITIPEHGPWHHENFIEFMIKHGHHLSHLSWHFQSVPTFSLDILQPFLSLLPFLPNLKILKLSFTARMSEELTAEFLKAHFFPKLEQLEFLDLENVVDPHITLKTTECNGGFSFKFLQHYGQKLKTLVISTDVLRCPAVLRLIKCGQFRNLRRLRLKVEWKHSLQDICALKLPLLEELQIYEHEDDSNWDKSKLQDEILKIINNFAQSLVHLQIFVSLPYISPLEKRLATESVLFPQNSNRGSAITQLPKLVTFSTSLWNKHSTWFWPFVTLQCPNLEQLSMHSLRKPLKKDVDTFSKAFELGSNPKLKKIRIMVTSTNPFTTPERVEITTKGVRTIKFKRIGSS